MNKPKAVGRWVDLGPRVASAVVLVAVGAFAIFQGGWFFVLLVSIFAGAMIWEFLKMHRKNKDDVVFMCASLSTAALFLFGSTHLFVTPAFGLVLLLLLGASIAVFARAELPLAKAYPAGILVGCATIVLLGENYGMIWVLWLVVVVAVSDIAGYFAGKSFGGPKFWPAISPKKTWSGTIAGWAAAAGAGLVFAPFVQNSLVPFVLMSVVLALAAQFGDILESAIKRNCNAKDSSNLIPGHGGFMDRFDGLMGAAVVFLVMSLVSGWPGGLL